MYYGYIPVGCASFERYDDECAEVKRVFIKEEYRGRWISKILMELFRRKRQKRGLYLFNLESGEPFVAAMALYRSIGHYVIPNYGQYKYMPDSVCMRKKLL